MERHFSTPSVSFINNCQSVYEFISDIYWFHTQLMIIPPNFLYLFLYFRYRQCSDPSLRRSVLICNTLRRLEREMESEPPEVSYPALPELSPPSRPLPVQEPANYEQSLREMTCSSGRATPFPNQGQDTDSGIGEDEATRPINWGSVLSLSSQTDLESLNNNELYAELGLSSDPPEWKESSNNEWDGFMHVLVGGT